MRKNTQFHFSTQKSVQRKRPQKKIKARGDKMLKAAAAAAEAEAEAEAAALIGG